MLTAQEAAGISLKVKLSDEYSRLLPAIRLVNEQIEENAKFGKTRVFIAPEIINGLADSLMDCLTIAGYKVSMVPVVNRVSRKEMMCIDWQHQVQEQLVGMWP